MNLGELLLEVKLGVTRTESLDQKIGDV